MQAPKQSRAIAASTLVVGGDAIIIRAEHAAKTVNVIPDANPDLPPRRNHRTLVTRPAPLVTILEKSLTAPRPEAD